ncbi:PP2C family protein-serine/threonine phosphatase [Sulfitobacter sabulilitoris]|uniref:Fused response regulator/phosphatase n=1 Tax=Sulfitobacter sabulilitoris TaxID=2562655 RepID=A0A5S3PEY3_9RHOB|nr:SpoIIE family protein phosphatase [Sulfitobacter sabulilitoris]TMM52620.1 fused response regulator/phosphatase [Sulfitobacter sabulilitoris]
MTSLAPVSDQTDPVVAPDARRLVLIVDDSRLQRKILNSALIRWGYEVAEADSAERALEMCKDRLPDLVLSDWMMDGMSGLEFCQKFRDLSVDKYGYFILLTSKNNKGEVARGLDAGADDFLSKPVDGNELRARMTAGERILEMQRELSAKNGMITETLAELQRLYDSIETDLLEAKKLQQSLLRERYKVFDTGVLSLMLKSSGHVGGDLVGFYPSGPGHLGLYAIDVSGHGISSALMTARLAGYLSPNQSEQNIALELHADGIYRSRPPSEAIETLNDLVLDEMETEHYFTFLMADIDLETGWVTIGQAGHPHPVIQRRDGRIEYIGNGGFPVGLMSGVTFSQFDARLEPGDRLLILSDGVTECTVAEDEMLGEDGLSCLLEELRFTSGPALLEALMWRLTEHAGPEGCNDDVSGILFEYSGPA